MLPGISSYCFLGPTFGVMHNLVEPRMRATATALLFFVLNMIALGGGPLFTGMMSDFFAQHAFTQAHLGQFLSTCPGGVGPKAGPAALKALCLATSANATRWAILVTLRLRGVGIDPLLPGRLPHPRGHGEGGRALDGLGGFHHAAGAGIKPAA